MFFEILLKLAFLFLWGAMIGWVIELFYRRGFGDKKWVNPGFLKGPYLPLYGFGLVILFALCRIDLSFVPQKWLQVVLLLVIMCIAMTAIEYVAGIIFIKGMHIMLWDYSDQWGNIQGVICPLFSFFWTAIGALYYFLLDGLFLHAERWMYQNLPVLMGFLVGLVAGVFLVDLVKSTGLSLKLRAFAKEHNVVVRYEQLKGSVQEHLKSVKEKYHFFAPFKSVKEPLEGILKKYLQTIKEKEQHKKEGQ